MISSRRFVAVCMVTILILALTYVSVTHAADAQPTMKWSAPAALVVQTCGRINAVVLTHPDGKLERFDYSGLTTESLRLYLDKIPQVFIINAPCGDGSFTLGVQ